MRPGLSTKINGERSVAKDRRYQNQDSICLFAFNKSLIKIVKNNKSSGLNYITRKPGHQAIKLHAQLSMKFQILKNKYFSASKLRCI